MGTTIYRWMIAAVMLVGGIGSVVYYYETKMVVVQQPVIVPETTVVVVPIEAPQRSRLADLANTPIPKVR